MKAVFTVMITCLMVFSTPLFAGQAHYYVTNPGQMFYSGGHAAVIVDMPPQAWNQEKENNQPSCLRCCSFNSRHYSEGSVIKSEGVLLQCASDERSVGTNNLIWKMLKQ
ncbi:Protein of unknown function [Izhakiella capsodis]|uniref:DUF1496 domain-containing protein n=1 Tax=Izhakiella capsodis TaxID=1367852 RepID=A0A1I4Z8L0_9GAMM|nr:DUF1496 domain-containing protein [Izhakiella capsodis]SFN46632.1 Protein of unknown function [Izhakiella capsodis]